MTLIETIIYLAIFSIMMSGAVASTYQLARSGEQLGADNVVSGEIDFIFRKISWLFMGATSANILGPDILEINRLGDVYTLSPSNNGQALTLDNQSLNTQRIQIEDLEFTAPGSNRVGIGFKVNEREFYLEQLVPP
ncbi:MAG: hypothetical protein U9M92_02645 [Patescibacteria group bacterium]|nr:hypothetical protein [Patescibacteria group bacterium]